MMWRVGQLARLANYVRETREELEEMHLADLGGTKGSTLVVMISLALLGVFTVVQSDLACLCT